MKVSLIERSFAIALAFAFGAGVGMASVGIVSAARALTAKTCNSGSACVQYTNMGGGPGIQGSNTKSAGANAFGLLGTSSGTDGVHGTSTHAGSSGVAGIMTGSSSSNGNGVYGQSSDSSGKYAALYAAGYNSGTYVFQGFNFSTGDNCKIDPYANLSCTGTVKGNSPSGVGVSGTSTGFGAAAVAGVQSGTPSQSGVGVFAETSDNSGNYAALQDTGVNTGTYLFNAYNLTTGGQCIIDPHGNLSCTGSVSGGALRIRQRSNGRGRVLAYVPESASATIEDVGSARMDDGVGNVQIPPDFASTMDPVGMYYVFLTPLGDTRGLYVSFKGSHGFQVRETGRGRSSLAFDYRIVAHPLAASTDRLPPAGSFHRLKMPNVLR